MAEGSGPFNAVMESVRVPDASFLLVDDPDYPGKKPFATYSGFRYAGGYSDHLPVIFNVRYR
jgi:hypothetical protein